MKIRITIRLLLILICLINSSSLVFPQTVKLTWTPSTETTVSHYTIYRSIHDTLNFRPIGTAYHEHSAFTDKNIHLETRYFYAATSVLHDGTESVFSDFAEVYIGVNKDNDLGFELDQNYPNPFNPSTNIHFSLTNPQFVIVKVFDIRGREILTLFEGQKKAGHHKLVFDGKEFKNGIFFVSLNVGGAVKTRRMLLLN